jgi:hypothetical protein
VRIELLTGSKLSHGRQLAQRLTSYPAQPDHLAVLSFDLRAARWPLGLVQGGFSSLCQLHVYFDGPRDSQSVLPLLPMAVRTCSASLVALSLVSCGGDPAVEAVTAGALCTALSKGAALRELSVSVRLLQGQANAPEPPAPFLHARAALTSLRLYNSASAGPDGGVALYALQRAALGGQLVTLKLKGYNIGSGSAAAELVTALGAAVTAAGSCLTSLTLMGKVQLPIGPLPRLRSLDIASVGSLRCGAELVTAAAQVPALVSLKLPSVSAPADTAAYRLDGLVPAPEAAGPRLREASLYHPAQPGLLALLHAGPALRVLNIGGGMLTALSELTTPTIAALVAVGKRVDTVRLTLSKGHRIPQLFAAVLVLTALLPQLRRVSIISSAWPGGIAVGDADWQLTALQLAETCGAAGLRFCTGHSPALRAQLALPPARWPPHMFSLIASEEAWHGWSHVGGAGPRRPSGLGAAAADEALIDHVPAAVDDADGHGDLPVEDI